MRQRRKSTSVIKNHAQMRAIQRYHVDLSEQDINNIVAIIQGKDGSKYVERKQSHTRTIFCIPYCGVVYRCIYCRPKKTIVTFLPFE